jgi:hypothetical protein
MKGPRGTHFIYNGDGSGDAEIVTAVEGLRPPGRVQVPVDDLVAFVGELVRQRRMAELEDATPAALLGLQGKR